MIKHIPCLAVLLLFGSFLTLLPLACRYDNEEDLYGDNPTLCDTAGMRFNVEIRAIFEAHCARCHVPGAAQYSGIPLATHAQMETMAKNGRLVGRINNSANPMPPSGLMPACQRAQIEAWVRAGALNN